MDKDALIKKTAVAAAIFLAFILLTIVYRMNPDIRFSEGAYDPKSISATDIKLYGWENQNKSWEIEAQECWTTKSQDQIHFMGIKNGTLYSGKHPIIYGLKAQQAVSWTYLNKVEASSDQVLEAYIDLSSAAGEGKGKTKSGYSYLKAKSLTYFSQTKRSEAKNVYISNKRYNLHSQNMAVDHSSNIASFSGSPRLMTDNISLSAVTIESMFDKELLKAYGDVVVQILGKKPSTITGSMLEYTLDDKSGKITGNAIFLQKQKKAKAGIMIFDEKKKTAFLTGGVASEFTNDKNEPTLVSSQHLSVNTGNGDCTANSSVVVIQKDKKAKSDAAVYNEKEKTITMTGNVFVEKGNGWIKNEQVIVSVKDRTFDATGNVEGEFTIER